MKCVILIAFSYLAIAVKSNAQELQREPTLSDDYLLSQYIETVPESIPDERLALATDLFNDEVYADVSRPFAMNEFGRQTLLSHSPLDLRSSRLSDLFITPAHQRKTSLNIRSSLYLDPNASTANEYTSHLYRGTPIKTMTTLRYHTNDFTVGITQAKGAGEPMYFDHIGGNISFTNPISLASSVTIKKFVLGDYSLSFGEGLLFNNSLSQRKSADAITPIIRRPRGISPYYSSSDYQFFRGGATSLRIGVVSIDAFYSDRKIDATASDSDVTSLSVTGYHRTTSELARRGAIGEVMGGSRIGIHLFETDSSFFSVGATGFTLSYDRPIVNDDSFKTKFTGQNFSAFSLDASALFMKILLRGEYAKSRSDATSGAFVLTSLSSPFTLFDLALNYRYLPENFISPFGTTFGDNTSNAQNERGLYVGLRKSLIERQLSVEGYIDLSTRTERTQFVTLFPATRDVRLSALYLPASDHALTLNADIRFRARESAVDDTALHNSFLKSESILSGSIFARYRITSQLEIAMKIGARIFTNNDPTEKGLSATFIARYYPLEELKLETGISYYNADSYDTRLFLSESEVYGTTLVQLFGEGNRFYILAGYTFLSKIQLKAKLAESSYLYKDRSMIHRLLLSFQLGLRI
jgi:hypothetical protein